MNGLHAALLTIRARADVSADGPRTVPLGLPRDTATRARYEHQYCPVEKSGAAGPRRTVGGLDLLAPTPPENAAVLVVPRTP